MRVQVIKAPTLEGVGERMSREAQANMDRRLRESEGYRQAQQAQAELAWARERFGLQATEARQEKALEHERGLKDIAAGALGPMAVARLQQSAATERSAAGITSREDIAEATRRQTTTLAGRGERHDEAMMARRAQDRAAEAVIKANVDKEAREDAQLARVELLKMGFTEQERVRRQGDMDSARDARSDRLKQIQEMVRTLNMAINQARAAMADEATIAPLIQQRDELLEEWRQLHQTPLAEPGPAPPAPGAPAAGPLPAPGIGVGAGAGMAPGVGMQPGEGTPQWFEQAIRGEIGDLRAAAAQPGFGAGQADMARERLGMPAPATAESQRAKIEFRENMRQAFGNDAATARANIQARLQRIQQQGLSVADVAEAFESVYGESFIGPPAQMAGPGEMAGRWTREFGGQLGSELATGFRKYTPVGVLAPYAKEFVRGLGGGKK